jgi:hypothetical protein
VRAVAPGRDHFPGRIGCIDSDGHPLESGSSSSARWQAPMRRGFPVRPVTGVEVIVS